MSFNIQASWTFTGNRIEPDATIAVDDQGTTTVTPAQGAAASAATVHSYPGCTALPGLIDMHTHVAPGNRARPGARDPRTVAYQTLQGVPSLASAIRAGITTIRDAGAGGEQIFALREMVERGVILGPRIRAAGEAIAITGGHGWMDLSLEADGPEGVTLAVRQQIKNGADCIKLMITGGAGTDGEDVTETQMSSAEIAAAVEVAHAKGKHVFAHVTNSQGALRAIECGVDCIEHGIDLDDEIISAMVERRLFFCPTLQPYRRMVRLGAAGGYPAYMLEKAQRVIEPHTRTLQKAIAAGVRIICGTDSSANFRLLGEIAAELADYVEEGLSPLLALESATSAAAECLREPKLGRLGDGCIADVTVVRGNPAKDIAALGDVVAVYKQGRLVHGGAL